MDSPFSSFHHSCGLVDGATCIFCGSYLLCLCLFGGITSLKGAALDNQPQGLTMTGDFKPAFSRSGRECGVAVAAGRRGARSSLGVNVLSTMASLERYSFMPARPRSQTLLRALCIAVARPFPSQSFSLPSGKTLCHQTIVSVGQVERDPGRKDSTKDQSALKSGGSVVEWIGHWTGIQEIWILVPAVLLNSSVMMGNSWPWLPLPPWSVLFIWTVSSPGKGLSLTLFPECLAQQGCYTPLS